MDLNRDGDTVDHFTHVQSLSSGAVTRFDGVPVSFLGGRVVAVVDETTIGEDLNAMFVGSLALPQWCTPAMSTPAAKISEFRAKPWAVIRPPYDRPHRPIRLGSTSGRLCRYWPAASWARR